MKIWLSGALLIVLMLMMPAQAVRAEDKKGSFVSSTRPSPGQSVGSGAQAGSNPKGVTATTLPSTPRVNPEPPAPERPGRPPGGRPPGGGHGPRPDPPSYNGGHGQYDRPPSWDGRRPPRHHRRYYDTGDWYGYYYYDDDDDDEDDGGRAAATPEYQEPPTYFSAGPFERFDPYDEGYSDYDSAPSWPSSAVGAPDQLELNQYEKMMRAW